MEANRRWTWLNVETGEFSKSWDDQMMDSLGCLENPSKLCDFNLMNPEDHKKHKLISYTIHNDDDFIFNDHMRLA